MKSIGRKIIIIVLLVLTGAISSSLGSWLGYQNLEKISQNELFRYSTLLNDLIGRYQVMSPILASNALFKNLLLTPDAKMVSLTNNQLVEFSNYLTLSSDIYILNVNGHTLASSNWNTETSFIGRNFSFRPYFQQAMTGAPGFYFALGLASKLRGLYFSYPIVENDNVIGVLVLKISVAEIESEWRAPDSSNIYDFVVTDKDSVIFLSSNYEWRYRSVLPVTEKRLETIKDERRYLGINVSPLGIGNAKETAGLSDNAKRFDLDDEEYIRISMTMPGPDWVVSIFAKTNTVYFEQLSSMIMGLLFIATVIGIWLFQQERQARLEHLESSRRQLETRVAQRTQDLEVINARLVQEIDERTSAEQQLKAAQNGLIQAAKLATLGQMSAGINHELNQPLTAIKAFSGNARKFLERGSTESADKNLMEILQLCDRMGKIISQFKMFSRKSDSKLVATDLQQILIGAMYLLQPMLDNHPAKFSRSGSKQPVWVAGDMVRLEQVMLNLLSNAAQATFNSESAEIQVDLDITDESAIIRVKDNGHGLVDTKKIFEPFFTTKGISEGLGLGLSISRQIIEAMNGTLEAIDSEEDGGAIFEIQLPLLKQTEEA